MSESRNDRWCREYGYGLGTPGDIESILQEGTPDPTRMTNTWANKDFDRIVHENPWFD